MKYAEIKSLSEAEREKRLKEAKIELLIRFLNDRNKSNINDKK